MATTVEALNKKKQDGTIGEHESRRLLAFTTLVKVGKAQAAAGDKKGFKPGSGMGTSSKLSASIMFHPINMRNAMSSMR